MLRPRTLGTPLGRRTQDTNGHEFTLLDEWGGLAPMRALKNGVIYKHDSGQEGAPRTVLR